MEKGAAVIACGFLLCFMGVFTLLPVLVQSNDEICENKFSLRLVWPSLIMILILLAYLKNVGYAFMFK